MRTLLLIVLLAATLTPVYPGSSVPTGQGGYKIEGRDVIPTMPMSTTPDYQSGRPSYQRQGDILQPVMPGSTVPDYSQPAFKIE